MIEELVKAPQQTLVETLRGALAGQRARVAVEPLGRRTTLRIGGPPLASVEVEDEEALTRLREVVAEAGVDLHVLGIGANTLAPDDGLEAVVVRLRGEFLGYEILEEAGDDVLLRAGGGVILGKLAKETAGLGIGGLEALGGFPASVGGAVAMNAGCYGVEIVERIESVEVIDAGGRRGNLSAGELDAGYRRTRLRTSGEVVTSSLLRLRREERFELVQRLDELNRRRWASLPSGRPNAGSTFRNPEGDYAGRLIEQCGLKGHRIGDAALSDKHANVVVNLGSARAADVLDLMSLARERVAEQTGRILEPEFVMLGNLAGIWTRRFGSGDEALPR